MDLSRRGMLSMFCGACASVVLRSSANAQCAPVDLGIPNISQQTPVWCWAAVAEQIIRWRNGGSSPPQCALVAMANNFPPQACCAGHPACVRPGALQQIQLLIANFGYIHSSIQPPAHPHIVYSTLSQGRAIILQIQSPYSQIGHVVVLRGMSCFQSTSIVHINDPMNWHFLSQPVQFAQFAPHWRSALVVG